VKLDEDRARYWIGVGAKPSDRVHRFLDAAGILERAARNNPKKGEPGEAAKERAEEKAEKLKEAEEAKAAAAAENDATGSAKTEDTAEAVADAVTTEDGDTAEEKAAIAEQTAEAGLPSGDGEKTEG